MTRPLGPRVLVSPLRGDEYIDPPAAASPPEGEICSVLTLVMLMRTQAELRANFPLRGKSRIAGIGVHFHRPQGGWLVFHQAKPGCMVLLRSSIYNGARKGTHFASAAILYSCPGRMPSNHPGGEAGPGQKLWPGAAAHGPSTLAPARARQPSGIQVNTANVTKSP